MASGRKQSNMGMGSMRRMVQHQPRVQEPETSIGKALSGSISFDEPEPLDLKPITRQISPEVRQGAFIKDPYEGRINVFEELEKGNPLSEYGLKQMHHAFDLAEYSRSNPKTPEQNNLLNQGRKQLQDALAHNDFLRVLRESDQDPKSPTFKYRGLDIPKTRGFDLMRREQESFHEKDRWLNFKELAEVKDDLEQRKPSVAPYALKGGVQKNAWVSPHNQRVYIQDDTGEMTWDKLVHDWYFEQGTLPAHLVPTIPLPEI